jgi:hypothetical protein
MRFAWLATYYHILALFAKGTQIAKTLTETLLRCKMISGVEEEKKTWKNAGAWAHLRHYWKKQVKDLSPRAERRVSALRE